MPMLGADMEAGTLVEWLKQPGDALKRGDIIAVVDTEKGAIEIEVFEDGVLDRAVVSPGEKVPVGTVLAVIRGAQEAPSPAPPAGAAVLPARELRASPSARKAAEVLSVDLTSVTGSGPRGAITREDVERAAARRRVAPAPVAGAVVAVPVSAAVAPATPPADKMAAMRAAIGAAMSRS